MLEDLIRQEEQKESKRVDEYKDIAAKLNGVTLKIGARKPEQVVKYLVW